MYIEVFIAVRAGWVGKCRGCWRVVVRVAFLYWRVGAATNVAYIGEKGGRGQRLNKEKIAKTQKAVYTRQ